MDEIGPGDASDRAEGAAEVESSSPVSENDVDQPADNRKIKVSWVGC